MGAVGFHGYVPLERSSGTFLFATFRKVNSYCYLYFLNMNLSEELLELLEVYFPEEIYPLDYFVPVKSQLPTEYFFPLGEGIYEKGKWKVHDHYPLMVLAEDCGEEKTYLSQLSKSTLKSENFQEIEESVTNVYWNKLLLLLGEEAMKDCFFSHAIMGLRKGHSNQTTSSFVFTEKGQSFLKTNQKFFMAQLELLEPDVIIALGINQPKFLAGCFPKQLNGFSKVDSIEKFAKVCPKGFIEIFHDEHPLRIVFILEP